MCGRTGLSLDKELVRCACSYKVKGRDVFTKPDWINEHNNGKEYTPSHNIAPTQVTPVLVSASKYIDATPQDRVLKPMMWGLIPPWHKGDYNTHKLSTNNCRLEGIHSSKLYSPILRNGGRCVIVAEGFYEWQTTDKSFKVKKPYFVYAAQDNEVKVEEPETWNNTFNAKEGWRGVRLLFMAGLYHTWHNNDTVIYSYTVITMDSNSTLSWLHHRMPAILDTQEQIEAWLDIKTVGPDMAISYLKPVTLLSWHEVSTLVNNSRNKSDQCNKRRPQKNTSRQKTIVAWFTKPEKRKSTDEVYLASKKNKTSD